MRRSLLTALLATGCPWIDADELAARNDLDGDGVSGLLDCGDDDPAVGLATLWYADPDGDGWGEGEAVSACDAPDSHVAVPGDCSPMADRHPEAPEQCNGVDDDCDGFADEVEDVPLDALTAYYVDGDGDGYGTLDVDPVYDCGPPAGHVVATPVLDCDDADGARSPGASERCENGTDDDCDGAIDEEGDLVEVVPDVDGDGFAGTAETSLLCVVPEGFVEAGTVDRVNLDCNDADASVHFGAVDPFYDGIDADCDGRNDYDRDGDGVQGDGDPFADTLGEDCNDDNPLSTQGWSPEIPYDGVDQDCNGADLTDVDRDGVVEGVDCNDFDPDVLPGQVERCNNVDDDCDGVVDEEGQAGDVGAIASLSDRDNDGAAFSLSASPSWVCGLRANWVPAADAVEDCDDEDDSVRPGRFDVPYDGVDQDCDGEDQTDVDDDGFGFTVDCDDTDAAVSPAAEEVCANNKDDDCDGAADDEAPTQPIAYVDGDGDGAPGDREPRRWCVVPGGYVLASLAAAQEDCDDDDGTVSPEAVEVPYDGVDQDCDGAELWDVDGDGVEHPLDCDDDDDSAAPGLPELCDDVDNDCNGRTDDDALDAEDYVSDNDRDGWAGSLIATAFCVGDEPDTSILAGRVSAELDCDDDDALAHPTAPEIWYDGIDEDCLGGNDFDQDGDRSDRTLDCDDTDPDRTPDPAGELDCTDGVDNDCDGRPDFLSSAGTALWELDADLDTFPDRGVTLALCGDHPGWVAMADPAVPEDCDDSDAATFPGAPDLFLDGIDRDCDELDSDRDHDGDPDPDDCGGDDPTVFHGAVELCDDIDQDCDGKSGAELPIATAVGDGGPADVTAALGALPLEGVSELWLCGVQPQMQLIAGTNSTIVHANVTGSLTGDPLLYAASGAGQVTLEGASLTGNGVGSALVQMDGGSLVLQKVTFAGSNAPLAVLGPATSLVVTGGSWDANLASEIVRCDGCARVELRDLVAKENLGRLVRLTGAREVPVLEARSVSVQGGGGLFSASLADVELESGQYELSVADHGGVGDITQGTLTVAGTMFVGNGATDGGVFHAVQSTLDFYKAEFEGNMASNGGAVVLEAGTLLDQNSNWSSFAEKDGGAVHATDSTLVVTGSTFRECGAERGAGLYLFDSTAALTSASVWANVATAEGGGIALDGSVLVAATIEFLDNVAGLGGGIWFSADSDSAVLGTGLSFEGSVGGDVNEFHLPSPIKKTLVCLGSTGECN